MQSFYLIVLWPSARNQEERILADLRQRMPILADLLLKWPKDAESCFTRFYGCKAGLAREKAAQVGSGEFRLLVICDEQPLFEWRETSRGHERVNAHVFDLKNLYRQWTGGGHAVHTTNTPEEARRDFHLLTGRTLDEFMLSHQIEKPEVLPGTGGWRSLSALFRTLGECLRYVVLRNSEELPDRFDPALHGDIDLLVDDEIECASVLSARKVFDDPNRVHYEVFVAGRPIRFDFRYVGDRYYDSRWQRAILENRVKCEDGIYRPDPENAFYSLVYHVAFQKFAVAPDYPGKIARLADAAGLRIRTLDESFHLLEDFIRRNAYLCERPSDPSVFFDDEILRWRQIAASIESSLPVSGLRLVNVANRKPQSNLHTLFYVGITDDGRPCFVKYMPKNIPCMRNEWQMNKAFHSVNAQHCAAPLYFQEKQTGSAVIVSELLVGRNLSAALNDGSISSDLAADLADQIMAISGSLKKLGICHRDIRPDNLFLTRDKKLKLLDFQFATPLNSHREMAFAIDDWEKILLSLGESFRVRRGLWNDALSFAKCVPLLPEFPGKSNAVAALESDAPGRYYAVQFPKRMLCRFRIELLKMRFQNFRHRLTSRPAKNLDQIEFLQSACGGVP